MKKYSNKHRSKLIRQAIGNMNEYSVICLESAIWGLPPTEIEKQIGEMSLNQWRTSLDRSLKTLCQCHT